jgi:hypothetical protein
MLLRSWRFLTLMLAVLGLAPGAAHVLELRAKLALDAERYAAVANHLYRDFAPARTLLTFATLAATLLLLLGTRGRRGFRWGAIAAVLFLGSYLLWVTMVEQIDVTWGSLAAAPPEHVANAYLGLRERWEYGQVAAFAVWFAGIAALVLSVLVDTVPPAVAAAEPEEPETAAAPAPLLAHPRPTARTAPVSDAAG